MVMWCLVFKGIMVMGLLVCVSWVDVGVLKYLSVGRCVNGFYVVYGLFV